MNDQTSQINSDTRPPVSVLQYAHTVARVNIGYDLTFLLANCFLRAMHKPQLNLLVVGVGGGKEIEQFLPGNPGWSLSGVDPSQDMLELARATAQRLDMQERVTLLHGTVDDLSPELRFDAATCMNVLHFLPNDVKLKLLKQIAARLRPQAPLFIVSGVRVDNRDLGEDMLGAWQQHGELLGLPAERMAAIIQQITPRQTDASSATEEDYVEMLHAAGFQQVAPVFNVMSGSNGSLVAWIARTGTV